MFNVHILLANMGRGVVTTSQIRTKALQALRRYPLPLRTSHEVTHLEGMGKAGVGFANTKILGRVDLFRWNPKDELEIPPASCFFFWNYISGLVGISRWDKQGLVVFFPPLFFWWFFTMFHLTRILGKKGNQVTVIFHSFKGQNEIR